MLPIRLAEAFAMGDATSRAGRVVDLPQDERQNKRSQRGYCLVMALNCISVERKKKHMYF
jgi:hypothetical protein